tara:strand:- start:978 stop:1157 length:180 start_codon:yes stop_codon:yes gene_type:complete
LRGQLDKLQLVADMHSLSIDAMFPCRTVSLRTQIGQVVFQRDKVFAFDGVSSSSPAPQA